MNYRQRVACGLVAAAVTSSLVIGLAPAVMADDVSSRAVQAASVIERATGTDDLAVTSDGTAVINGQGGQVSVTAPDTSDGSVKATAADGSTVALSLPRTKDVTGIRAGAGTVVYPDAAPATDIAVQATTDGGARALVTLKTDKAPTAHDFTVDLPEGAELVPNDHGGYDITKRVGAGATVVMGQVDAPWAKDATGKELPTHYTLNNTTLTQTVDTDGAAFPVVADPKWTWGIISGTVYLNRDETNKLIFGASLASLLGMWSGPLAIPGVVTAAQASYIYNNGQCVKIKYGASVDLTRVGGYSGGYCR
ncbi:hypothetical protein [Kitasatospora sp. NPDC089509]|uniref:hypothetical protein n=1 Tax=Kitasatospora sp. NPDC089509 TaxID=3364079 RepID=UPI0037F44927